MSAEWNERWAPAARKVAQAKSENFVELLRIGGLDPAQHLRFADWADLELAGCDLRGFDFTGARLAGCDFRHALIDGARFDQALIDGANLREAADWAAHVKSWHRPAQSVSDDHLPVGAVFQDAPFGPEMVVVPPGRFAMGSPEDEPERDDNEGPQHEVTIAYRLAVGRYAITFDEWDFAQADKDWQRITGIEARKPDDEGWGRGDCPVINVSWEDAQAYVRWLRTKTGKDYRLLSEAEWEYVCRGGTETPFWWGSSITPEQANYDGDVVYEGGGKKGEDREKTLPVRSFEPNPWGLYQVHGNVDEWCEDSWHGNYDGAPDDGRAWTDDRELSRVLRGGAWSIDPWGLRSACRDWYSADVRSLVVGFRVARTLTP